MKVKSLQIGMFVSVTDEYRATIPAAITWCKGQGKVIGFEKREAAVWSGEPDSYIPKIKWADGTERTIHSLHLQPSTKKEYFMATLS